MLNYDSRKKPNGASHFTQSHDWISFKGQRVVSQAGAFTQAYLRNTARSLGLPTGVTREPFYTAYPNGVLYGIALDTARIAVSSAGVFKPAAGNSSIPIGQPAYLRSISSQNNWTGFTHDTLIYSWHHMQTDTPLFMHDTRELCKEALDLHMISMITSFTLAT